MSSPQIGPVLGAWYRWKALRLPWRRRFLVGLDLQGNTYWIFKLSGAESTERWRRIVKYPRSTQYSEVKITPQWHQWLRYQRENPPSIAEQAQEVTRQHQIKLLAAEADARWEAKPRVTDIPGNEKGQSVPVLGTAGTRARVEGTEGGEEVVGQAQEHGVKARDKPKEVKDDPWKRASGPSETWQPEAWSPSASKKR
ncbi:uncharacterized protein BCR38DRAFT_488977 [Pseudomassariella vexata]|uniref:Uncharacterized protein n=1 Tax=Pseudomassariella vexata TaxID=1141098 RepID=A0A1Y2DKG1_9PEZI|nr:uncharacterized protein BCR38DRAFT_488977 [Pseudomassariella vexata]ORY59245.1 hypothetical protein BCR38DRAFT_488977 [Pseudomassariella vexata]